MVMGYKSDTALQKAVTELSHAVHGGQEVERGNNTAEVARDQLQNPKLCL